MIRIERHDGPRDELRELFAEAEDSTSELDAYIDQGIVIVARIGDGIVGHLQLVGDELKNMAVAGEHRGRGVGRQLVDAAIAHARTEGRARMVVATATADIGNLRFYQRLGFRMLRVERDAFTPRSGYPEGLTAEGIPVRDRVWLDLQL